jgi:hypothetical protein
VVDGTGSAVGIGGRNGVGFEKGDQGLMDSAETIEERLIRARLMWKRMQYLKRCCVLGTLLCCLTLCVGIAVWRGVITTRIEAICTLVATSILGVLAWMFSVARVAKPAPKKSAVAAELERKEPRFQDRLNTLVFLQDRSAEPCSRFFLLRIADQARRILSSQKPARLKGASGSLEWLSVFALSLVTVLWLNYQYAPWKRLRASTAVALAPDLPGPKVESTLLASKVPENGPSWGEVRITRPGTDLKVSKVDVVPLSIESATAQELQRLYWCSEVNGAEPEQHDLPQPREPHYAAFESILDLHEMQLSDWDVVTYYAKAETTDQNSYISEIYFVEIRPHREDLLRMPGGQGGEAYRSLSDLSSLVTRQQHVIRETRKLAERPPSADNVRKETLAGLATAETELAASAQHAHAEMVARSGGQAIGGALDQLAQAESSLNQASMLLERGSLLSEAQSHEQVALARLVGARKELQKAVSDRPEEFIQSQNTKSDSALEDKRLNEMAEFRDEQKSAQEFVQDAVEQQKDIERKTGETNQDPAELAAQEQRLQHRFKDFMAEHPRAFKGLEPGTSAARDSLQRAEESLRNSDKDSASRARQATEKLEKLRGEMASHGTKEQLANAYRLKQMLEDQVRELDRFAVSNDRGLADHVNRAAASAQAILDQLRRNVNRADSGFGPSIRNALSSTGEDGLEGSLSKLQQEQTDADRRSYTEAAAQQVEDLKRAFAESQPKPLQEARRRDSLKPESESGEEFLRTPKNTSPEVASTDPMRLPAAYRARIQKYFQKLSEE